MRGAMDPSLGLVESKDVLAWILDADRVIVRAAATAVGAEGLETLVAHFKEQKAWLICAKVHWAAAGLGEGYGEAAIHSKAALALIKEHSLSTDEAQQLVSSG